MTIVFCFFCECTQDQSAQQILPKTTPDSCDVQVFERVGKAAKNECLNVLSLIGNAKSFGDRKVFQSKNTKNTIKTNFPTELNNFEIVETNKGNLVFGYNYSNVLLTC